MRPPWARRREWTTTYNCSYIGEVKLTGLSAADARNYRFCPFCGLLILRVPAAEGAETLALHEVEAAALESDRG